MRSRLITLAAVAMLAPSAARAQTDAFAGKTIRIIVPFATAGTYGQYALLAASHIRKHLPGNPTVIVQEMQGAAGVVALTHVATVAPKDGTTAIVPAINIVQDGLLDTSVKYDPASFVWIGRMMELVQLGVASERSGLKTLDDAKARPVNAGGSGATNPTSMSWHILNLLAGTKFNVISGYKGLPDSQLAWERGEVDTAMLNWETAVERYDAPIKAGRIPVLFAYAGRALPELKGRPVLADFARDPVEKAFVDIYTSGPQIGRSIALPGGVPPDRIAVWRKAFDAMLKDPDFLAEIAKRNLRFDPLNGDEIGAIVKRSLSYSPETLAAVRTLYAKLLAQAK